MLTDRVVRHLLERGAITSSQADDARRTQSLLGGRLESHLLKLGFVDEQTLGDALTEAYGVPYASEERLSAAPPAVLSAVPAELARRHRACPFLADERRLRVAMIDPHDARAVSEIQAAAGWRVEPWVTSEFRLYQALGRHYGAVGAAARSAELAPPAITPPRRPAASRDPVPAGPETGEPDSGAGARKRSAEADSGTPPVPAACPPSPPRVPAQDPLGRLEAALETASDRDALAAALLDYCASHAARCALFAVGRDGVRGVAGRGRGFDNQTLKSVRVSPSASTVFDAALRSRDFYFGLVPPLPGNRDLYTVLGGRLPATALVLPIQLKERTVALLYLDDDERPMTRPDIPAMRRAAAKAGLALEVLLLRAKLREA